VVVAGGGRVVKTVGDEILFVATTPTDAAAIALALAETMAAAPDLPDVRVGLATGPVVSRLGDVFGATVNIASRLTAMAQPGTVLVDGPTAAGALDDPSFELDDAAVRAVRGMGLIRVGVLRRRAEAAPADAAATATNDEPARNWDCARCLRVNVATAVVCRACGAPRTD
jgi:adenylate cyclase